MTFEASLWNYCSLAKAAPTLKRVLTPYYWPDFLYRVKIYSNKCPRWSELCVDNEAYTCGVWEVHPQVLCTSEVRNFVLYFIEGYYKVALCRQTQLMQHAPQLSYTMLTVHSEFCLPSELDCIWGIELLQTWQGHSFSWLNSKHMKEWAPPGLADLYSAPPMDTLLRDYGSGTEW